MADRGAWQALVAYGVGDTVWSAGNRYTCAVANAGRLPAGHTTTHWTLVPPPAGPAAASIAGATDFDNTTPATDAQVVAYSAGSGKFHPVTSAAGVVLDTTAGDIAPLGAQAAGATGKAADAGHVHPVPTAVIVTAADGATVTFDLSLGNTQLVTLGGSRTLAVTNDATNQRFTIIVATGAGAFVPVWWAGIRWVGGSAPTVTATANKYDVFTFLRVGSGAYLGFVVGQAL